MNDAHNNPLGLMEVSQRRRNFLRDWLYERQHDLKLRGLSPVTPMAADATEPCWQELGIKARPYDHVLESGDIRLVPNAVTDPVRFTYLAILDKNAGKETVLAAPFSPYENPATKSEWLTPLESTPLKVLQLWAALPVPKWRMMQSWRCCSFTDAELRTAREIYRHTIAGTWPELALRESIGLDIHNPNDPRIDYQEEELALYAPLRKSLFDLLALIEHPKRHFHLPAQVPLPLAAASGESRAVALLLDQVGELKEQFTAVRLSHDFSGEAYDSRWRIENIKAPLTGLPTSIYDHENNLIDTTTIEGADGNLAIFRGTDGTTFERLDGLNLKMVISEI